MAWASIGSRGTASLNVSGADLPFSPNATVAAGRILVLCIAWEIDYTRTPEGASWPSVAVHDNKGNLYTQLGGFSWESYVSIHVCRVSTAILTSDTITIHHRNPGYNAKAVTAWEFSMDTEKRWARVHTPIAGGNSGTATWSSSITGLTAEALIIQATSSGGPSTDTYTYDPDYTPFDKAGTTGSGTNVTITAQFRIANVGSDVASMSRSTNRATDVVLAALYEAFYVSDFPRFPVLDDFNRANEDPLDNGDWEQPNFPVECTPGFGDGHVRLDANRVRRVNGGAGAWYLTPFCGCYAETYVSVPVKGHAGVHMDGEGCGANATASGYGGFWEPVYTSYLPDDQFINGGTGNTGRVTGDPLRTWVDIQDGYRLGLQRDSRDGRNFIHGWINRGSGWEWASCWNDTGTNRSDQCRVGLSVWGDDLTRLDDFGAGASPCPGDFIVNMNWRSAERAAANRRLLTSQSGV